MIHSTASRILRQDLRRTTEVLEVAAGEMGDEFLQYLYGMACLHLANKARKGQARPVEAGLQNDPVVTMAAKLLVHGKDK